MHSWVKQAQIGPKVAELISRVQLLRGKASLLWRPRVLNSLNKIIKPQYQKNPASSSRDCADTITQTLLNPMFPKYKMLISKQTANDCQLTLINFFPLKEQLAPNLVEASPQLLESFHQID
jgi:hypothetical protein